MTLAQKIMSVLAGVALVIALGPGLAVTAAHPSVGSLGPKPPRGSAVKPLSLLGYGRAHGVIYRAGSPRAATIKADCSTACAGPLFYHGGPVMHRPAAYTIYWEPGLNPQVGTSFTKFPGGYRTTIDAFMQDVANAGSLLGSAFSVDGLYGEGTQAPGADGWTFGNGLLDTANLPLRDTSGCPEASKEEEEKEALGAAGLPPKTQPCITDAQIRTQLEAFIKLEGLPTTLGALYFVITPQGVNSCAEGTGAQAQCTTNAFCAYHSDISSGATHIVYANMPYARRSGCFTPDEPHKEAADDEIDVISHEGNEAITDPLTGPGEGAWFDYSGGEVADKCTYPFFEPEIDFNEALDAYGHMLGGIQAEFVRKGNSLELKEQGTAFNQLIHEGKYLLQREWSNVAGGCVTNAPVPTASFAVYSSPGTVGQAISFNGSASSTPAGQITSYGWSFGDGGATSGSQPSHTYSSPGIYTVTLTVTNDSGASSTATQSVSVQAPHAPEAPPAPLAPVILTNTIRVPVEPAAHNAQQIAELLGLPANGARLSGLGTIALGHAECPPACTVTLSLYATLRKSKHHHTTVKRTLIGTLTTTIDAKGTGALALQLNAAGTKLLHKSRQLAARLNVTVVGQEGGSWTIQRTLTLTGSSRAARRQR